MMLPGDAIGGEWDWWRDLAPSVKAKFRRLVMSRDAVMAPDQLAAFNGLDTAEMIERLTDAVNGVVRYQTGGTFDPEPAAYDGLMGPQEVAAFLCVKVETVHQWRVRAQKWDTSPGFDPLPFPLQVVSGVPIWERSTIEAWSDRTGRTPALPEPF
jgi:hypothetical protein